MDWSIWTKPADWPPRPHGFTWLMDAAEQVAKTAIGDDWVGNEFGFEAQHMGLNPTDPVLGLLRPQYYSAVWFWLGISPRGLTHVTKPSPNQWAQAYSRWLWCFENAGGIFERKQLACILLQKAAERGELQFNARNEATGEMVLIPRERWNCDTNIALARIARGRINLVQPMALEPSDWEERQKWFARMTSWLFVAEANLAAFLKSLSPQPALDAVKQTVAAEEAARKWLVEQFGDESTKKLAKPDFRKIAKANIAGLGDRAFDRAWAKAITDFPERAKGGSRGNRRTESVQ